MRKIMIKARPLRLEALVQLAAHCGVLLGAARDNAEMEIEPTIATDDEVTNTNKCMTRCNAFGSAVRAVDCCCWH